MRGRVLDTWGDYSNPVSAKTDLRSGTSESEWNYWLFLAKLSFQLSCSEHNNMFSVLLSEDFFLCGSVSDCSGNQFGPCFFSVPMAERESEGCWALGVGKGTTS